MHGTLYISKLKKIKFGHEPYNVRFLGVVTTYLALPYTSPLIYKSLLLMNLWNTTWTNICY